MRATFFKPSELRARAYVQGLTTFSAEGARLALANAKEQAEKRIATQRFDAFLSYSSIDWEVVYGLYLKLTDQGFSIYVDRVTDPHLDPANVSVATAEHLRGRMRQCRSLWFVTTQSYSASKWLPWEVGFFDGYNGKVAIIPVTETGDFTGQEYLGLYPVMESDLWLHRPNGDLLQKTRDWLPA